MNKKEFIECLSLRGISCTDTQYEQLIDLMDSTLKTNEKFNLTAITNEDEFMEKMILDSALALQLEGLDNKKCIDIGTGAGFPGMVLAILNPLMRLTLLDSTAKKINYLDEYTSSRGYKVNLVCDRAELYAHKSEEKYDIVFARAVSHLSILIELSMMMLKGGGQLIAYKGRGVEDEIKESENAFKKLGCHLEKIFEDELPESKEKRYFVVIKKDKQTPKQYPRDYKDIKSLPL